MENKKLCLWEIPLILMEGSLKGEEYMNLNPAEGAEVAKKFIGTVKDIKECLHYFGIIHLLTEKDGLDGRRVMSV
ncbi:hypothetical protein JTS97_18435 [Clostridium botulinum]|nr:hypothetical protein [Clostridium botulinum]